MKPRLLFLHHPAEVLGCYLQQAFELLHAVFPDLPGCVCRLRFVKESLGFLMVFPGDVQGVFQSCFVFESPVGFHETILDTFPG